MQDTDREYLERLQRTKDASERIIIASELNCPEWLLKNFCEIEEEATVVNAALLNLSCKDEYLEIAFSRFPQLDRNYVGKIRAKKKAVLESLKQVETEESVNNFKGDRDQVLLDHILEKDKLINESNHATLHLGTGHSGENLIFRNPQIEWADTKKFRIALLMLPSWGVLFPPYNIAKLAGSLRANDYSVKVYDANVESYHHFLETHGQDYWKSERYFLWSDKDNFEKYILPDLIPIVDKIVNEIIESNVKVVGFSLYLTNRYASLYMAKIIKELLPDVCLIAGGPETVTTPHLFKHWGEGYNIFNYIFVGEAEENLLKVLENLPDKFPINEHVGSTNSRLDLDLYSYPDYSDYDIKNYLDRGISIETSRGCVAQCSFCAETYFWKFRSLTPERVIDEMSYQINRHRIKRFWFVDSLANGNLKSFERLIDLIIERNLNILWNSYARCDGRMDVKFFEKIKKSGCTALSFGVESGSQKVLLDMRKKIDVWEIENNLRDGHSVGMFNHVNWLIGFPTEEAIDNFHSLQLLYNLRQWVHAISPGFGTGLAANSHTETDFKLYGIVGETRPYDTTFLGQWYTEGYKNTILHRFIRLKLTHIWLELLTDYKNNKMINAQRYSNIKDFYEFWNESTYPDLDYVEQDFHVDFNQAEDTFEGSILNEYNAFIYLLYKYFGHCGFSFLCDPEEDLKTFGDFVARKYYCKLKLQIQEDGYYTLYLHHKFDHSTDNEDEKQKYKKETDLCDKSFDNIIGISGNINEWKTKEPQVRNTIHEQYRK